MDKVVTFAVKQDLTAPEFFPNFLRSQVATPETVPATLEILLLLRPTTR